MTIPKFVLDTSVALKWFSSDREAKVSEAKKIYDLLSKRKISLITSPFLLIELINILILKKKADPKLVNEAVKTILNSRIRFVETDKSEYHYLAKLVNKYKISAYDAQYLYLAKKYNLKLLTEDKMLLKIKKHTINLEKALIHI